MRHSQHFRFLKASAVLITLSLLSEPAMAFDVFWTGGTGDWTNPANWDQAAVPEADPFEDIGIINNGGTATLSVSAPDAAGLVLGQADGEFGTLQVLSGGSINLIDSSGEPEGVANIGLGGTGVLEVRGGGALSATSLDQNAGSQLVVGGGAGAATVSSSGESFFDGTTIVRGGGHNFYVGGNVYLEAAGRYVADLRSSTHTSLISGGEIFLGGTLAMQTTSYAPSVGTSWKLFDATSINGTFQEVDTSALPVAAAGTAYAVRTAAGGNGQVFELSYDAYPTLTVNTDTGVASISSPSGTPIDIVGYSLFSPTGRIQLANWQPLQGNTYIPGWEIAGMPSAFVLDELNAEGELTLGASPVSLGSIHIPASNFGEPIQYAFEYAIVGETNTLPGLVEITGSAAANNLLLTVDPLTGEAQLQNSSEFTISLAGYSILSESGALQPNNGDWLSLEDSSVAGWEEATPTQFALSELLAQEAAVLSPGQAYSLGELFSVGEARDLVLEFALAGETDNRLGVVKYGAIEELLAVEGDYNNDGVVNLADYTVWRDSLGGASLANQGGISPGVVDTDDYAFWKSRFGATTPVGAGSIVGTAQVPEPQSVCLLAGLLVATVGGRYHKQLPRLS